MGSCLGKDSPSAGGRSRAAGSREGHARQRVGTDSTDKNATSEVVDGPFAFPAAGSTHTTQSRSQPTEAPPPKTEAPASLVEVLPRPTRQPTPTPVRPLSPIDTRRLTLIMYAPADQPSSCAYCDNPVGDKYDYLFCRSISLDLLEDFMEHGWWRTGQVIFKPRFREVCCPSYALRMPAAKFVPSKSHRHIIRKWSEFLKNGDPRWENRGRGTAPEGRVAVSTEEVDSPPLAATASNPRPELVGIAVANMTTAVECGTKQERKAEGSGAAERTQRRPKKPVTPGKGPDPNKPPCKKAKEIRAERRAQKLATRGGGKTNLSPSKPPPPRPKRATLQELLESHKVPGEEDRKHTLEVRLLSCNPRDPQLSRTLNKAYQLYDKFQEVIHPGKTRFHSPMEFEWGFISTPLQNPQNKHLGTYHMHYYLDGELVMISILDILPKHFVSIYFIYDPDIRFTTPGIYTCLREIELVQHLQQNNPDLVYYDLGYYNHFSPKVSYKKQFGPQELLCNETNVFVPIEVAIPKFLIKRYIRVVDDDVPEKEGRTAPLDDLVVNTGLAPKRFGELPESLKGFYQQPLRDFISEAGSSAAHQCLIEMA